MRGKYKRKRLSKKYKQYTVKFQYWRDNPYKFAEEMLGIKLSWWQKLLCKLNEGRYSK